MPRYYRDKIYLEDEKKLIADQNFERVYAEELKKFEKNDRYWYDKRANVVAQFKKSKKLAKGRDKH